MALRYKCIVLDHDDTTIDSTPKVHYMSYVNFMKRCRPTEEIISLEEWYSALWDNNTSQFLIDVLKLSKEEMKEISVEWMECFKENKPKMFEGFWEFLVEFKRRGGILCICSHGENWVIKDFYSKYNEGILTPDAIYGFDKNHPELCKPFSFPVDDILVKFNIQKKDIVVIDDLYHGLAMAQKAGVDSIGTLYGEGHDMVKTKIIEVCKKVVNSVNELKEYIFYELEN